MYKNKNVTMRFKILQYYIWNAKTAAAAQNTTFEKLRNSL